MTAEIHTLVSDEDRDGQNVARFLVRRLNAAIEEIGPVDARVLAASFRRMAAGLDALADHADGHGLNRRVLRFRSGDDDPPAA